MKTLTPEENRRRANHAYEGRCLVARFATRYVPEHSGAVLDLKTGLREWFNSHAEAIAVANARQEAQRNG